MTDRLSRVVADNRQLWHTTATEAGELCLLQARRLGSTDAKNNSNTLTMQQLLAPIDTEHPLSRCLSVQEQLAFCQGVLDACPDFLHEEGQAPLPPSPASPKVVFLDSTFSREALLRFQQTLPHPRPLTAPSFTAVCELLESGAAEFAILPLEDSKEGKFLHLHEQLDHLELRISYTCDIPYPGESRSVTMGLVAKRYLPPQSKLGTRLFSCRLFVEDPRNLTNLLNAAEAAGPVLRRLDSSPAPYGENGIFYELLFSLTPDEQKLFEIYLAIYHPRAHVLGHYFHLK